jgi:hypothetical protein
VPEDLFRFSKTRLSQSVLAFMATLSKVVVFFLGGGGFPHLIVVKFSDVSDEPTTYNLRVTQLFQVDAKEKRRTNMRRLHRMV